MRPARINNGGANSRIDEEGRKGERRLASLLRVESADLALA
jgi:hypothetical protein